MVAGRPPRSFCTGPMPYDCGSSDHAPKNEGYLPAFVNNLVSPFMSCWQPPINTCVSPTRRASRGGPPPPLVSPQQAKPQPTTNIREPHSNDVLCGRGGSSNRHVGNLNFRSLVAANKDMYVTLTKKQKMMVARKIVGAIHSQDPPGRFLQKDSVTGLWFDIGLPRSLEKTSQALREKIAPAISKQQLATPVSPGGSSVTALTSNTEDTFSDPGVHSPMLSSKTPPPMSPAPPSPPGTASSSPVQTPSKPAVSPNEIPSISIPQHLESQFRPRRRMEARPPVPQPRFDARYYPPPQHHHHHPAYGPPPQPYLHPYPPPEHHHDYYHRGPPPPGHYPYPPPMPMAPRQAVARAPPYPPRYASSSVAHHVPPSPDRRDYHNPRNAPTSPPTPRTPVRSTPDARAFLQQPSLKGSGAPGRQATEVSPGRRQAWKKRRVRSKEFAPGDDAKLTRDMESQLSFRDHATELKSPSAVLQSRSRRSMAKPSSSSVVSCATTSASSSTTTSGLDALAGLAALSSAALLKLHEGEK